MNRFSVAVLVLCAAIAAISIGESDWSWLTVAIVGIAVVWAPMRATGDPGSGYDERLMGIAVMPLAAFLLLFAACTLFGLKLYYPLSVAIQACAGMAFGTLAAVLMSARAGASLPRRWAVLFALVFASSLSVLYTLFNVYWMSSAGYQLYNINYDEPWENDGANMALMVPMAVTMVVTILYGLILNEYLKRVDCPELFRLGNGGGP
jgi:hypothetical protein